MYVFSLHLKVLTSLAVQFYLCFCSKNGTARLLVGSACVSRRRLSAHDDQITDTIV